MAGPRILFCGSRFFGQMAWSIFRSAGLNIVGACSLPQRVDFEKWWLTNTIAEEAHGVVSWVSSGKRNEDKLLDLWKSTRAELLVSVQHPWVFTEAFLKAIGYEAINFHNAPLPKYGGFDGVVHAILNDETYYGITVHGMTRIVDWGPVIFSREFPIGDKQTAIELYRSTLKKARCILHDFCTAILSGRPLKKREMSTEVQLYSREVLPALREIKSPWDIERWARAFWFPPYEPAYMRLGKHKVHVKYDHGVHLIPSTEKFWEE